MDKKTFYVTTPIYYPSGKLHIGHTYTTVAADAIARFKRFTGYDVKFLTGTDEHGQKIQRTAQEKGLEPKIYLDGMIEDIKKLWATMEISYDDFIRTTEERHTKVIQKIFEKLYNQGDIYKAEYEGWYCTPCESFWTQTQLLEGNKCPDCGREAHLAKEEAYFFKMSKYRDRLIEHFEKHPEFCFPEARKNEMLSNFLNESLEDLCVSRTTFDWGIKVPFDTKHVIYVWIDALCNYITALGYMSDDDREFKKYWPANVHMVGKEIVRFHSIIWPALLMALDVPLPKQVFGHGWILFGEDKMSKSKGNIVYPEPLIERYGIDALKYFLLREFTFGKDGNYTNRNFLGRLNSDLANDLGNLVSRTITMIQKYSDSSVPAPRVSGGFHDELRESANAVHGEFERAMDALQFSEGLESVWRLIRRTNKYIDETMPWALAKDEEKREELDTVLYNLAEAIRVVGVIISPLMHVTSGRIFEQLGLSGKDELTSWESVKEFGRLEAGTRVSRGEILFPRLDVEEELKALEQIFSPADSAEEQKPVEHKEEITIDDFAKLELRVGTIKHAEKHPKADKLLVLKIQIGSEQRQIVSGIAKYYSPEELVGKNIVVVCNLKPVKLRGIESQGMILAAATQDGSKLEIPTFFEMENGCEVS